MKLTKAIFFTSLALLLNTASADVEGDHGPGTTSYEEIELEGNKALTYAVMHEHNEDWNKAFKAYKAAHSIFGQACAEGVQDACFDMFHVNQLRNEAKRKYEVENENIFARHQRDYDQKMVKKCSNSIYRLFNDECDYYHFDE